MNRLPRFIFTINLLVTVPCMAMKKEPPEEPSYKTLTCIQKAFHAHYLQPNRMIISNNLVGCDIIDPIADKKITEVYKGYSSHVTVHPNKQKFALGQNQGVTVYTYDNKTDLVQKIWSSETHPTHPIYYSLFSPYDETIITKNHQYQAEDLPNNGKSPDFLKHNYSTGKVQSWNDDAVNHAFNLQMAFHPTNPHLCLAHTQGHLSFHNQEDMQLLNALNPSKNFHHFCFYNTDGSMVVCGNKKQLYIIYLKENKKFLITPKENHYFDSIALHPNGATLALLLSSSHIIYYFDMHTHKIIEELPALSPSKKQSQFGYKLHSYTKMCFSLCRNFLFVGLPEKCILLPLSFNIIYPPSIQKQFSYLLLMIKNNAFHQQEQLPKDVVTILLANILKTYGY